MAKDELTGNMPTERLIDFFDELKENNTIDKLAFAEAISFSSEIFLHYH